MRIFSVKDSQKKENFWNGVGAQNDRNLDADNALSEKIAKEKLISEFFGTEALKTQYAQREAMYFPEKKDLLLESNGGLKLGLSEMERFIQEFEKL